MEQSQNEIYNVLILMPAMLSEENKKIYIMQEKGEEECSCRSHTAALSGASYGLFAFCSCTRSTQKRTVPSG